MNFSTSDGVKTVCIDDSGITVTWQMFIPGWKPCPFEKALEMMQHGQVVNVTKIDENNTLALVRESAGCGYPIVFGYKDGTIESRYTFMGPAPCKYFFDTLESTKPLSKEEQALTEALSEAFADKGEQK